jgi:biopolymer transport protein TolR
MPSLVNRGRGRRTINEINMVPFIDVMLVLLIIFMVTAPLIAPSVINLPSVGKGSKTPDVVVQIIIGKDETMTLKSQEKSVPVTLKDLVASVKTAQTAQTAQSTAPAKATAAAAAGTARPPGPIDSAVVISADRSVKYETVVKVMDVLQRAGVQRVGLSVQLVN